MTEVSGEVSTFGEMNRILVEIEQTEPGRWGVRLRFIAGIEGGWLVRRRAYLGGLPPNSDDFDIDPEAPYRGVLAKRRGVGRGQLLWLPPGSITTSDPIALDAFHDTADSAPAGARVRYRAGHPVNGVDDAGPTSIRILQSDWLALT